MNDETALLFVEDYVRRHGPTKISHLSKLLNIDKKHLRDLIKSSVELSVDGCYAKLRELVHSEFGEVTPEELSLLRRHKVPTPSEIEDRKRIIIKTTRSSRVPDSNGDEPSDLFERLNMSTVESLTNLNKERSRQLASQIGSDLLPSNDGRPYNLYIHVNGKGKNAIKGWAALLVDRNVVMGKFVGYMPRVSVTYAYMSVISKVLKFIPVHSSINIIGGSRSVKRIERSLFDKKSRLTPSEKEMRDSLLPMLSSYNIKFKSLKRSKMFAQCQKLAAMAKGSLLPLLEE